MRMHVYSVDAIDLHNPWMYIQGTKVPWDNTIYLQRDNFRCYISLTGQFLLSVV